MWSRFQIKKLLKTNFDELKYECFDFGSYPNAIFMIYYNQ